MAKRPLALDYILPAYLNLVKYFNDFSEMKDYSPSTVKDFFVRQKRSYFILVPNSDHPLYPENPEDRFKDIYTFDEFRLLFQYLFWSSSVGVWANNRVFNEKNEMRIILDGQFDSCLKSFRPIHLPPTAQQMYIANEFRVKSKFTDYMAIFGDPPHDLYLTLRRFYKTVWIFNDDPTRDCSFEQSHWLRTATPIEFQIS